MKITGRASNLLRVRGTKSVSLFHFKKILPGTFYVIKCIQYPSSNLVHITTPEHCVCDSIDVSFCFRKCCCGTYCLLHRSATVDRTHHSNASVRRMYARFWLIRDSLQRKDRKAPPRPYVHWWKGASQSAKPASSALVERGASVRCFFVSSFLIS